MIRRLSCDPAALHRERTVSPGWWARIATISAIPSATFSPCDLGDEVALAQAGLGGRAVRGDREDLGARSSVSPVSTVAPITG